MILKRLLVTAVTAAAAVVAVPAQAANASALLPSALHLSVIPESGVARSVTLQCFPAGGTHPNAEKACADLDLAGGDPAAIKHGSFVCTAVVQPVTATAIGYWMGRLINYEATHQNGCWMVNVTGNVFTF